MLKTGPITLPPRGYQDRTNPLPYFDSLMDDSSYAIEASGVRAGETDVGEFPTNGYPVFEEHVNVPQTGA